MWSLSLILVDVLLTWFVQDLLVVAIGKYVVTMDVAKIQAAGPPGGFSIDEPSVCRVENPLEGVSVVGTHTESVTDLGIPEYSSTRIASSSQDGVVCFSFIPSSSQSFDLRIHLLFCRCGMVGSFRQSVVVRAELLYINFRLKCYLF